MLASTNSLENAYLDHKPTLEETSEGLTVACTNADDKLGV